MNEPIPVCYFNGKIVPQSEALVPVSALSAQTVYDTARTYVGKLLTIRRHVDRVFEGCRYFGIELALNPEEMVAAVNETLQANLDPTFMRDNGDYLISILVSAHGHVHISTPSLLSNFRRRACFFRNGAKLFVASAQRHIPPQCLDARVKVPRPWFQLALREAAQAHPECWPYPIMLDLEGNVAEMAAANIFLVKDGALHTPFRNVLLGCSRRIVCEICAEAGIPVIERDVKVFDLLTADEVFFTGTSYGMLPATHINGRPVRQDVWGPVTERVLGLYSTKMGVDIRNQYLQWENQA